MHMYSSYQRRYLFFVYKLCRTITGVYFHRLKINHESHEFILDPGTVANKYSLHRTESSVNQAESSVNQAESSLNQAELSLNQRESFLVQTILYRP